MAERRTVTKRPRSPPTSPNPSETPPSTRTKMSDEFLIFGTTDLDDEVHQELDEQVVKSAVIRVKSADSDLSDKTDAMLLLATIIKRSYGRLDAAYRNSMLHLDALFLRHAELHTVLQEAWARKQFKRIRTIEQLKSSRALAENGAQALATQRAWQALFRGKVHEFLWEHMVYYFNQTQRYYDRSCSIMQSSGMGKSRAVDELSKTHFVIPINLRADNAGYPPPDDDVHDYLCEPTSQNSSYLTACGFLAALFEEVHRALSGHPEAIKQPEGLDPIDRAATAADIAALFRAYKAEGMTVSTHGRYRREFYARVVDRAKRETGPACTAYLTIGPPLPERNSQGKSPPMSPSDEEARQFPPVRALVQLVGGHHSAYDPKYKPLVTLVFDDAHTLAEAHPSGSNPPDSGWTHLIELCKAIRGLYRSPLYSLFLSTSGKIAPPERPQPVEDPSSRTMSTHMDAVPPFTDLGFDQLVYQLSLDGKEIAWITSDDVISHLGRPIFGAWFDCDDGSVRSGIVSFAAKKLLGGIEYNTAVPVAELLVHAKLTCLAQRFPIDFILTPNPHQSAEMAQLENHTRVCLKIDLDSARIVTVASSEPLLFEAAYWVMQNHAFDAPGALVSVLRGVTADKGSRGELVVMLALTLAWDRAVGPAGDDGRPVQRWTTLPAFFRHLFHSPAHTNPSELHDDVFAALGQTLSPAGPIATEVTFEDQFQDARVYFNHFIKVHEHSFINRAYFAALSYRGTAVLCEDSKSGIDGIVPFCVGPWSCFPERMGAILPVAEQERRQVWQYASGGAF
ncbi:hypothetical protein BJ138DRAFT_1130414 [Hygrophoropsis aurantiaca]|uniref:Uncharacterized protein n=1 Tax=Hygrophoropsis aurantiaca TaxID=72124 RepID=A0ACB7ZWR0_9AGAM|nr:hypothetical protein BJ138DRAFT_1130414 [Hygrophoropsis aurantiaca]